MSGTPSSSVSLHSDAAALNPAAKGSSIPEGIDMPDGIVLTWDSQQLRFEKGHKLVTDSLMSKILYSEKSRELQMIDLGLCYHITDMTLLIIADIPSLRLLNLAGCFNISDKGIMALSRLPNLNNLVLYRCQRLTDAAVKSICTSQYKLFLLSLSHCYEITSDAFEYISQQSNLIELDLTYTKITDQGLRYFGGLSNLVRLILYYCTGVTKGAIPLLCSLPNLVEINCRYTKVSKGNGFVFTQNNGRTKIIAGDK